MFEKNQKNHSHQHPFLSSTSHTSLQAYGYSSKMQKTKEGLYEISNFKNGGLLDKQTFSTLTFATAHLKFCDRLNNFLNERYFISTRIVSDLTASGLGTVSVGRSLGSYWAVTVDGKMRRLDLDNSTSLDSEKLLSFIFCVAGLALTKKLGRVMKSLSTVAKIIWRGQTIKHNRSY